jgi:hypothetical protein
MNDYLKFCSILSIIIASIKLAMIGSLTTGTIVFIIKCGLLILSGNPASCIIIAAIAALVLFVKLYEGGNPLGESSLVQASYLWG